MPRALGLADPTALVEREYTGRLVVWEPRRLRGRALMSTMIDDASFWPTMPVTWTPKECVIIESILNPPEELRQPRPQVPMLRRRTRFAHIVEGSA